MKRELPGFIFNLIDWLRFNRPGLLHVSAEPLFLYV